MCHPIGPEFVIRLPVAAAATLDVPAAAALPAPAAAAPRARVLIVDDNEDAADLL